MIQSTCSVSLESMDFFAYHGFHAEEQKIGNKYTVQVTLSWDQAVHPVENIQATVDYEKVYKIVHKIMTHPQKLLESVAHDIADNLLDTFSIANRVAVIVVKHNPPIGGLSAKASVCIDKLRLSKP